MKLWQILLLVLMVSGCAAELIQLPNFEAAARSDEQVTDPVALPDLCMIPWTAAECWQRLDVFEDVSIGNTETAQLNADIARLSDGAYDDILSGAIKQQEIGQIRQQILEAEQRDHFIDNLQHRVALLILALGLIL